MIGAGLRLEDTAQSVRSVDTYILHSIYLHVDVFLFGRNGYTPGFNHFALSLFAQLQHDEI
jgi:hypothetical protein